ncbi:MAG TPA: FkbM family methyltransferase [Vicinamibacterales bacterium]|nr:FkbM family methyltransferase [Vicinamibacterales bacterium]
MSGAVSVAQLRDVEAALEGRHAAAADGRRESNTDGLLSGPRGRAARAALTLLQRANLLWRFNFTVSGRLGGRPVIVPLIKGEGIQLIRGDEPWMLTLLAQLMSQRPGAFIDVGANLGQTLIKVRAVEPDRPYIGFEPNAAACHYCRELIRVNRYRNVTLFPVGLSTSSDVVLLFSKAETDPSASIVADFRPRARYSGAQPVSVHAGDEVLKPLGLEKIGIVKIDVEGGELDVMRGLLGTIRTHRPIVLCEVLPVYDPATPEGKARKARQDQLQALLVGERYAIHRIMDGTPTPVAEFGVHGDIALSNYVFVPADLSGAAA